jgi:NADH dehydrogenase
MILVTGSTGFVGRSVTRILQEQGRPFKVYQGRINDPLTLRAELLDVDSVIHLAGAEARDRVRLLEHVDVEGTERLLEEGRRAGVGRLVVISRLNATPNAHFALLRAKGRLERVVRGGDVPYTIVRSATLFGRHDRFLNVIGSLAVWTWPFVWLPGGGRVAMQPLWVEDLARCLVACLDKPELIDQTIEIAGEDIMRYEEIVRQVLITAPLRRIPFAPGLRLVRLAYGLIFGWWPKAPVTRFFLDRFTAPEVAPVDSVRRLFGFKPARMNQHMATLRRPGLRWRVFRLG